MLKTKVEGVKHLFRSYLAAAPHVMYSMTLSLVIDPRKSQHFIHRTLDAIDVSRCDLVIGSSSITEIIKTPLQVGGDEILITAPYYLNESSDTRNLLELSALAYLVRTFSAPTIFEIGTFVGRTTRLFAQNAQGDAKIFTLDLPQDHVRHQIGRDFKGIIDSVKIQQLFGDSKAFDFSCYHGSCDFVWIDGNHDYPFVKSDTQNAFKLVKPGGWIGWHDYHQTASWSGVTRTIRELKKSYPAIRHIKGTTTVLLQC